MRNSSSGMLITACTAAAAQQALACFTTICRGTSRLRWSCSSCSWRLSSQRTRSARRSGSHSRCACSTACVPGRQRAACMLRRAAFAQLVGAGSLTTASVSSNCSCLAADAHEPRRVVMAAQELPDFCPWCMTAALLSVDLWHTGSFCAHPAWCACTA